MFYEKNEEKKTIQIKTLNVINLKKTLKNLKRKKKRLIASDKKKIKFKEYNKVYNKSLFEKNIEEIKSLILENNKNMKEINPFFTYLLNISDKILNKRQIK